ncbi:MAG: hypothetical protein P0S95_04760 [Rhabdochlamydiaceae bacterium]|nr:hypothetical protein [Candidatus Amphrikana amoebophyrae]
MCESCYDAQIFAEKVKNRSLCTGEEMLTMNYDTLKYNLTQEWIKSDKSEYYIFRKAINDAPSAAEVNLPVSNADKKSSLHIHFV